MSKTAGKHIISLFSANAVQIAFSQLGSLFLFWLSSKELSKTEFGNFNWYFAICGTVMAICSFGFDFVVIKKISARNEIDASRIQLFQNVMICLLSIIVISIVLAFHLYVPGFKQLLLILVAFQFTYLGLPFKNALTGKELFARSARTVVVSNSLKIALVLFFYLTHQLTLFNVTLTLALSNLVEFTFYILNSFDIFDRKLLLDKPYWAPYKKLFRESLPQLGVIIFDSAFARIDWILLGIISSNNAAISTAEYSFAYKIFEISRLPLLVLAPILFTRFSRLLHLPKENITEDVRKGVFSFLKLELIIGMLVPLFINLAWVPLMLYFTGGKYGPENQHLYLLLSLTLPVDYMVNFLWTIAFAQGQLRLTMALSIINSVLNILLNLVLIPLYGPTGAAIAYLSCNLLLLPMYLAKVRQEHITFPLKNCLAIVSVGLITGVGCYLLPVAFPLKWLAAITIYTLAILNFKIFNPKEIKDLKHFISQI